MNSLEKLSDNKYFFFGFCYGLVFFGSLFIVFVIPDAEATSHKTSIIGDFEGKFDHTTINSKGEFHLNKKIHEFTLLGEFSDKGIDYKNYNCKIIDGNIALVGETTQVYIDFNGKKCQYGLFSYVVGTFEVIDSSGKYKDITGDGRISFVADHHANNVYGILHGSFVL